MQFHGLHHHHHSEETLIFPYMETKLGKGAMESNYEQHHAFMDGVKELETFLNGVQDGTQEYNGERVIEMLEGFAPVLAQHLHDEIPTLDSAKLRAAMTVADLKDLEKQLGKKIMAETSLSTQLPVALVCHEMTFAPWFPGLPAPAMFAARYMLFWLHSDAWAFGPCTAHGVLKPGLGNVPYAG